ncbi:hypothetical protein [Flavobacterium aquidurense]|uniref:Uncharacterized protein n=1 Tax=Flavobacterium aquidurense TaxID=362413 RepID=A0A0Q0WW54_9FLAO|nr:hypothetical protein [Flavobacterium aquidurense]KQB40469.1 hypothetical protein RC62_359 [Flavobacterium aquidurense]
MDFKNFKNPQPIVLHITLENKEKETKIPVRNYKRYDYYNTKKNPENKNESVKVFLGSLIVLTAITSFIALLIMIA